MIDFGFIKFIISATYYDLICMLHAYNAEK